MDPLPNLVITLIVAPSRCAKCEACKGLITRLQERFPDRLDCRELSTDDEAAAAFGVVLPPVLIVGDFVAALGNVPQEEALTRLVAGKLAAASTGETSES
jgi:hypothetical protein